MLHFFTLFVLALGLETIFHTTTVFDCDSSAPWISSAVPSTPANASSEYVQSSSTSINSNVNAPIASTGTVVLIQTTNAKGSIMSSSSAGSSSTSASASSSKSSNDHSSSSIKTEGTSTTSSVSKFVSSSTLNTKISSTTVSGNAAVQLHPLGALNVLFW